MFLFNCTVLEVDYSHCKNMLLINFDSDHCSGDGDDDGHVDDDNHDQWWYW